MNKPLSKEYLLNRGYCCNNKCFNCPYTKNNMKNNYIIGAGPAGLIAAYYMPDYKVIDKSPLGQLRAPFIPGPRLLQSTPNMKALIKEIFPDWYLTIQTAKVGYSENGKATDVPSKEFKSKYVEKTRGTKSIEGSHLSEGKNEIEHVELGVHGEESYAKVFNRLLEIIKLRGQLIEKHIENIDIENKTITFAGEDGDIGLTNFYDKIVSTINLNILSKLAPEMDIDVSELKTKGKSFYKADYSGYHGTRYTHSYVYSADSEWTRKTYFDNYVVYESVEPITSETIEGNNVEMKFENLPIQIVKSKNIDSVNEIKMLGRFAQWNHKIKANEALDRVISWIS